MSVYGNAIPVFGQVTLSTSPVAILAGDINRRFAYLVSTLAFSLIGSTTRLSTEAALVPPNVPFTISGDNLTSGAIYGIAPAGTAPVVSYMKW